MTRKPLRLSFVVPGAPRPKARARTIPLQRTDGTPIRNKHGRIATRTFTPAATAEYESRVRLFAQAALNGAPEWRSFVEAHPTGRIYRVHLLFVIPADRGDDDNYQKAAVDGMNGIAFADDRQIRQKLVEVVVDKSAPRTEVMIEVAGPPAEGQLWKQIAREHGWSPTIP